MIKSVKSDPLTREVLESAFNSVRNQTKEDVERARDIMRDEINKLCERSGISLEEFFKPLIEEAAKK